MAVDREMRINEMSANYGVLLRTLRYYEDRGILQPRRLGVHRLYGSKDRVRLQLILKGKRLGFSLTEIEKLLGLTEDDYMSDLPLSQEQANSQMKQLLRKRREVVSALADLRRRLKGTQPCEQAMLEKLEA